MISSVFSCQLVRDWTASRDALIRTFLSAFCLALLPTESKTYVRPLKAFHRHGKTINLVTGNLNLPLISTLPVVWPQRGASFCFLPAVQGQHKRNDIKKNSRAINISISKTVPQSIHLTRFILTPQINSLLRAPTHGSESVRNIKGN